MKIRLYSTCKHLVLFLPLHRYSTNDSHYYYKYQPLQITNNIIKDSAAFLMQDLSLEPVLDIRLIVNSHTDYVLLC